MFKLISEFIEFIIPERSNFPFVSDKAAQKIGVTYGFSHL